MDHLDHGRAIHEAMLNGWPFEITDGAACMDYGERMTITLTPEAYRVLAEREAFNPWTPADAAIRRRHAWWPKGGAAKAPDVAAWAMRDGR